MKGLGLLLSGLAGLSGAALMFVGDVLLYGPEALGRPATGYYEQCDPVAAPAASLASSFMAASSPRRTMIGGLLGPALGAAGRPPRAEGSGRHEASTGPRAELGRGGGLAERRFSR